MDLFDKIVNISGVDIEEEIKKTIDKVKDNYKSLERERTCFLYSSFIYEDLLKKHISSRIISTKDLGSAYEHRFVLVSNKREENYFLVDMTYSQFFKEIPEEFSYLNEFGYQKVSKDNINDYLNTINLNTNVDIDNIYLGK